MNLKRILHLNTGFVYLDVDLYFIANGSYGVLSQAGPLTEFLTE